jgi:hypothetical protein
VSAYPKNTAINPRKILNPVYNSIERYNPLCNSIRFSFVNEENVVNPPHNPTIRKSLHSRDRRLLFSEKPERNPIIKLPDILTRRVPTGIEKKFILRFSIETK